MQRYTRDTTCPKCLGSPKPKWHPKTDTTIEQLVLKCNWCGYSWVMLPADALAFGEAKIFDAGNPDQVFATTLLNLVSQHGYIRELKAFADWANKQFTKGQIEGLFTSHILPIILSDCEDDV